MNLAVVGSRLFDDYEYMKGILKFHPCTQIVSGGAKGADTLAKKYATEHGIPIIEILPNWNVHGKSAGYLRNNAIVEKADEVVAFVVEGHSKGTQHTINIAEKTGKPVHIYKCKIKESNLDDFSTI